MTVSHGQVQLVCKLLVDLANDFKCYLRPPESILLLHPWSHGVVQALSSCLPSGRLHVLDYQVCVPQDELAECAELAKEHVPYLIKKNSYDAVIMILPECQATIVPGDPWIAMLNQMMMPDSLLWMVSCTDVTIEGFQIDESLLLGQQEAKTWQNQVVGSKLEHIAVVNRLLSCRYPSYESLKEDLVQWNGLRMTMFPGEGGCEKQRGYYDLKSQWTMLTGRWPGKFLGGQVFRSVPIEVVSKV
ncbi:MAG: hypothetical protein VXY77_02040 [Pseudomonadota bacterium]|nr:hypothetical protein [Pseudomonadota bacterium]